MHERFFALVALAEGALRGHEAILAYFTGERSDFIRFNHARVRQPGSVEQATLDLTLIDGIRHDTTSLRLSGQLAVDRDAIIEAMRRMRAELASLPEDPYLLYSTQPSRSETVRRGHLATRAEAIDTIITAGTGTDLVGFYASGAIMRGYASSLGARHWHEVDAFSFDWSLYYADDKAVKRSYAGEFWNGAELRTRMAAARDELDHLARPVKRIEPGEYRTYLAPAAVDELIGMLNWEGVSERAQRTKQSPLQKLIDGEVSFAPSIHLTEHIAESLTPAFDRTGFARPASIDLIRAGRHAGSLVTARTGREYSIEANGAGEGEAMQAPALAGGTLPQADALTALDTGLYLANLWYLNFSDRTSCRVTGMTRFASFWVERGRIVAPLAVMRFDDSLYRMFGSQLERLTRETDWMLDPSTYGGRSTGTSRMPGALLGQMRFTL